MLENTINIDETQTTTTGTLIQLDTNLALDTSISHNVENVLDSKNNTERFSDIELEYQTEKEYLDAIKEKISAMGQDSKYYFESWTQIDNLAVYQFVLNNIEFIIKQCNNFRKLNDPILIMIVIESIITYYNHLPLTESELSAAIKTFCFYYFGPHPIERLKYLKTCGVNSIKDIQKELNKLFEIFYRKILTLIIKYPNWTGIDQKVKEQHAVFTDNSLSLIEKDDILFTRLTMEVLESRIFEHTRGYHDLYITLVSELGLTNIKDREKLMKLLIDLYTTSLKAEAPASGDCAHHDFNVHTLSLIFKQYINVMGTGNIDFDYFIKYIYPRFKENYKKTPDDVRVW